MSKTETPEYVDVVEQTYIQIEHGTETYEVKEYDSGSLQCPKCTSICDTEKGLKMHLAQSHNQTARIEYECDLQNCDETFTELKGRDKKYCSKECSTQAQQSDNTETCKQCGEQFRAAPSKDRTYCSRACNFEAQKRRETRTCPTCSQSFETRQSSDQTYCSRKCSNDRYRGGN